MLESVLPALQGLSTVAKAMSAFDAFRKGLKGDRRALIEELKENSRICFHIVRDNVDLGLSIPKFSTAEFDRLNKAGFNFNVLKRSLISHFPSLAGTDLATWPGKSTAELVQNIYDKIKTVRTAHELTPNDPMLRRRVHNIHKRVLLLLRHVAA